MKKFTLVSTVFNEAQRLQESINDIEKQLLVPDEIVIVDAGSKDGTIEILKKWQAQSKIKINVIVQNGCNVAQGRNLAIENASHELIVSTDFGCRYHENWLFSIVSLFDDPDIEVVGGNYSSREEDMTSLAAKCGFVLANGYQLDVDESFIPSSRSIAYYKYVWEQVGRYPEWLTLAADDLVFGMLFHKKKFRYTVVKDPYVYWGRHKSFKAYGKEAFRYGLGDGEAMVNYRNFISNSIETLLRYGLFICLFLIVLGVFSGWWILLVILFLPGLRSYYFAFRRWIKFRSGKYNIKVLLGCLYLIEVTRLNYIKGYMKAVLGKTEIQRSESRKLRHALK